MGYREYLLLITCECFSLMMDADGGVGRREGGKEGYLIIHFCFFGGGI